MMPKHFLRSFFLLFGLSFFFSACTEQQPLPTPQKVFVVESFTNIPASPALEKQIQKNGKGFFLELPNGTVSFVTALHLWGNEMYIKIEEKKFFMEEQRRDESSDLLFLSAKDFPMKRASLLKSSEKKFSKGDQLFFEDGEVGTIAEIRTNFSIPEKYSAFPSAWEISGEQKTLGDSGAPIFDEDGKVVGMVIGIEGKGKVFVVPIGGK